MLPGWLVWGMNQRSAKSDPASNKDEGMHRCSVIFCPPRVCMFVPLSTHKFGRDSKTTTVMTATASRWRQCCHGHSAGIVVSRHHPQIIIFPPVSQRGSRDSGWLSKDGLTRWKTPLPSGRCVPRLLTLLPPSAVQA